MDYIENIPRVERAVKSVYSPFFPREVSNVREEEERVLRTPLPLSLIRRMDELIKRGIGGYSDRSELIKEALEAYVLELAFEKAPELVEPITDWERNRWKEEMETMGEPIRRSSSRPATNIPPGAMGLLTSDALQGARGPSEPSRLDVHLRNTEIRYTTKGRLVSNPIGRVREEPMFGLHNRDYPSLWAAVRMVGLTLDDLADEEEHRNYLLEGAWLMGEQLSLFDREGQMKLSALFPTNKEKRPSAEEGFMNFAVGTVTVGKDAEISLSGPLFLWKAAAVELREVKGKQKFFVGLTEEGYELLDAVAGLNPSVPHPRDLAERFFEYLRLNAPSDWWGFDTVIGAVGKGIERRELIRKFHEGLQRDFPRERPLDPWTEVQAATNTAGYVARAREWGVLEPKQHRGSYLLTEYGQAIISGLEA